MSENKFLSIIVRKPQRRVIKFTVGQAKDDLCMSCPIYDNCEKIQSPLNSMKSTFLDFCLEFRRVLRRDRKIKKYEDIRLADEEKENYLD